MVPKILEPNQAMIVPKLMLNKLKVRRSYLYLYLFGDLFQRSFYGDFHMFVIQGIFFEILFKFILLTTN
jgi:hypothetical protein